MIRGKGVLQYALTSYHLIYLKIYPLYIFSGLRSLLWFLLYVKYIIKPMINHNPSRNQFVHPNPTIMAPQTIMPRMGISGTIGVLNSLCISGSVFRRIITAPHTSMKANKVPILVISPTISPGTKAANAPTTTRKIKFDLYGVLN